MKRHHWWIPDVPQYVADRACDVLERYLNRYGVTRLEHLPGEAREALVIELHQQLSEDLPQRWQEVAQAARPPGVVRNIWHKLKELALAPFRFVRGLVGT